MVDRAKTPAEKHLAEMQKDLREWYSGKIETPGYINALSALLLGFNCTAMPAEEMDAIRSMAICKLSELGHAYANKNGTPVYVTGEAGPVEALSDPEAVAQMKAARSRPAKSVFSDGHDAPMKGKLGQLTITAGELIKTLETMRKDSEVVIIRGELPGTGAVIAESIIGAYGEQDGSGTFFLMPASAAKRKR